MINRTDAFRALAADGLGVLDVGARGGSHPALREIAGLVHFVGFEADAEEARRLNAAPPAGGFRSTRFVPTALGARQETRQLHRCRSGGASSLLEPNAPLLARFPDAGRFDVTASQPIAVHTCDELQREGALPAYVGFMKIDTQGTELDILNGARECLRGVAAVEIEVEFAPLYRGQPLFRDVDAWLSAAGFSLFKLRRVHWVRRAFAARAHRSAGQLAFGDALYLRDPLPGGLSAPVTDARQAEALILLAALYDCHDFALELASVPDWSGLIDAAAVRAYVERRAGGSGLKGLWRRRADRIGLQSWWFGHGRAWGRGDHDFYTRA